MLLHYSTEMVEKKIEKEGGIYNAIEAGLRQKDIADNDVAGAWHALERAYDDFQFFVDTFEEVVGRKLGRF